MTISSGCSDVPAPPPMSGWLGPHPCPPRPSHPQGAGGSGPAPTGQTSSQGAGLVPHLEPHFSFTGGACDSWRSPWDAGTCVWGGASCKQRHNRPQFG